MYSKVVCVCNSIRKDTFPVTKFIDKARSFNAHISVKHDELEINGTSLLGMLSLQIAGGKMLEIIGTGSDEKKAVEALAGFLESGAAE